jgi:hypothetical protein
VKFIYQELPEEGAFITAQLAGNEVVYSVLLAKAGTRLVAECSFPRHEGGFVLLLQAALFFD